MKKLLHTMAATMPGLLVVLGSTVGAPVVGDFDTMMIPTATGEEIDQVALDQWIVGSNWPAGAYNTVPLVQSRAYRIEITGAFTPDPLADFSHDAECAWTSTTAGDRLDAFDDAGTTNDVWVQGEEVDWVATTPSDAGCNDLNHTYSLTYTPATTGTVNLTVHDASWYGDNSGQLTARLFTATASDPANPLEDAQELAEQVGGIATETAEDRQADVEEILAGEGIDPDDLEGSVEAKKEAAFEEAGEAITTAEEKKEEVENQLPDPGTVVEDAEQIIEDNDPGDPGGVDPSPVTDAVDAVLDEVEKVEPPDDIPNPIGVEEPGGGDTPTSPPTTSPPTTSPPTTSPPTTSPPTTSPPTTSPPTTPPENNSGSGGSGGTSGGTNEETTATPTNGGGGSADAGVFSVSETPGPVAEAVAAEGDTGVDTDDAEVKSTGTARAGTGTVQPGANGSGSVEGLMETELALGDFTDVADTDRDTLPRPRPVVPEPSTSGGRILMLGIAAGVLFGTFEMGRRALARIRAERAYDTYGF